MKHLVKALVIIVLIVFAFSLCACSEARVYKDNQEKIEAAKREVEEKGGDFWDNVESDIKPLNPNRVYYVPNGKSFHSTKDCVALMRSKTILHGTLAYVMSIGKDDPCSKCVGD